MKTLLIIAALVCLAFWAYGRFAASGGSTVSDPVTGMVGEDLKAKVQAEITVRMSVLRGSMQQLMAAGAIDPVVGKPVLEDLDRLHGAVNDSQRQLVLLGDSPERVAHWLTTLGWKDFQEIEARFRTMVGG
jgi:hypothetical protein